MQRIKMEKKNTQNSKWSLTGMTALVTGGTKGIGYATVEELAGLGATIHTCSRNETELNGVLHHWSSLDFKVTGSVCDVTIRSEREKLIEQVSSLFKGKLNILVNNAGTLIRKTTLEHTKEEFAYYMSVNLEASYHFCQLAHPLLKASNNGNIVFISSVSGSTATEGSSLYAATKGAINQITKNLACEWAKDNIRTNSVAPGLTRTPMVDAIGQEAEDNYVNRVPLQRIAEPNEISSVVAFLCLSAASYITGQVIIVDGGITINCTYTS